MMLQRLLLIGSSDLVLSRFVIDTKELVQVKDSVPGYNYFIVFIAFNLFLRIVFIPWAGQRAVEGCHD